MSRLQRTYETLARPIAHSPLSRSGQFDRSLAVQPRNDLVRFGSDYGGWTVPGDLLDSQSICYSAGVGLDITFDLALIERYRCNVEAFDPTPGAIDHAAREATGVPEFHLHEVGIWSSDREMEIFAPVSGNENYSVGDRESTGQSIEVAFRSIPSLMAEMGHEQIDLLKLDIEGSEYEVIGSLLGAGTPISILCVEYHKTPGIRKMKRASEQLREAGFVPVHRDGFDVTFVNAKAL